MKRSDIECEVETHEERAQARVARDFPPRFLPPLLAFSSFLHSPRSLYRGSTSTMGSHVSTVPDDAPQALRDLDRYIQVAKFTSVSALSVATYDHLACLDEEIEMICESSLLINRSVAASSNASLFQGKRAIPSSSTSLSSLATRACLSRPS